MGCGKFRRLSPVRLQRLVSQKLRCSQHLSVLARQRRLADALTTVLERQFDKKLVGFVRNFCEMQFEIGRVVVVHKWPLNRCAAVNWWQKHYRA